MRMRQGVRSKKHREEVSEGSQQAASQDAAIPAKPVEPENLLRRIVNNPNFGFQIMVIMLTFLSDNVRMDRRIDTMTNSVEKIRSITDIINKTMDSIKVASDAPRQIRKMLE